MPQSAHSKSKAPPVRSMTGYGRAALEKALKQFNQMREKEGASAAADIRLQLSKLAAHRVAIGAAAPEALKAAIQRFKDRVEKLLQDSGINAPLNQDVIEREIV